MERHYLQNINIKQWAEEDRPREKLLLNGRRSLTDAELMAILIGSGSQNETAVELSKKILRDAGNDLNALAKFALADLCKFKGIGEAKAITIIAALELGRRRKALFSESKPKISTSKDVHEALKHTYEDLNHEEFWVLLLNNKNHIIGRELISKGGIDVVSVDIKLIFHVALGLKATGIVLSHNHPTGIPVPSLTDISLTKKIVEAASFLEIRVLDHVIFGEGNYYSFGDEGTL